MRYVLSVLACFLIIGSAAASDIVDVRDSLGTLVEKRVTSGNKTTVRDPQGKLIRTETVRGNKVEIRDPQGKLIGTKTAK